MRLLAQQLTKEAFEPYGDVLDARDPEVEQHLINNATTTRFHALSTVEAIDGRIIVNLFRAEPRAFPFEITMMERHPLGSQTFYPLQDRPWLVVVAGDENGRPGLPRVFQANGRQGVTYARNIWHHPLIAMQTTGDFLVIDRDGEGVNLEEIEYDQTYWIECEEK